MKKAVVTLAIGDFYQKMSEITHPTIKKYAEKVGADFIVWKDQGEHTLPHYKKLDLYKLLDEYDRIIYVDTDILVREDAPDLFLEVPEDKFGIFDEGRFADRAANMAQYLASHGVNPKFWDGKYYNTGVMVMSKKHKPIFFAPTIEDCNFFEQTWLNFMIHITATEVHGLNYKMNRLSVLDSYTGEPRHDSWFLHYAGTRLVPNEKQFDLMRSDLENWKNAAPEYKYPKNVVVIVNGGIGDQVVAEPVVRYVRDVRYKGDNIVVVTDFPMLFDHLGLKVYSKEDKVENIGQFYQMSTYWSQEHASWDFMSHITTHAIDFASLQAIRSILPLKDRQIKLTYGLNDLIKPSKILKEKDCDFSKLVLLHPGRGWPSKTFPADVWQEYVNILINSGYTVGLIGKRIGQDQGVVEVDSSRCIDFIDQLTLKELIALIGQAPVLISNDSGPIHIAGAFDNHIGLIATCKHPEYILPYRNGSMFYKAAALENGGLYDTWDLRPSQVDGNAVHLCKELELRKYLPTSEKVLNFVKDSFSSNDRHGQ